MSKRFAKTDSRGARGHNRAQAYAMRAAQAARELERELHERGWSDEDIKRAIADAKRRKR